MSKIFVWAAKILVWAVLGLIIMMSMEAHAAVPIKDCNVGANPWQKGRQVGANEKEYKFATPFVLDSLGKGDKASGPCKFSPEVSTIVIPNGFDPSIDHPGLDPKKRPWIKLCGNPIVSKFRINVKIAEAEVVPVVGVVKSEPILDSIDPDYGKTKVVFTPQQQPEMKEPQQKRRVRYVVVQPTPQVYYSGGYSNSSYTYGPAPVYVSPQPVFTPAPSVIVPPPSVVTPPPSVVVPAPSVITRPAGPGVVTK